MFETGLLVKRGFFFKTGFKKIFKRNLDYCWFSGADMLVKTDPWSGTGLKAFMFIFYLSINVFYEVLRLEP